MRQLPADWVALHPAAGWLTTFREAGVDLLAYDGVSCPEAAGRLAGAVRRIEADPEDYKLASPAGRDMRVIDVLRWAAEKCARTPRGTVTIRVRNAWSLTTQEWSYRCAPLPRACTLLAR